MQAFKKLIILDIFVNYNVQFCRMDPIISGIRLNTYAICLLKKFCAHNKYDFLFTYHITVKLLPFNKINCNHAYELNCKKTYL